MKEATAKRPHAEDWFGAKKSPVAPARTGAQARKADGADDKASAGPVAEVMGAVAHWAGEGQAEEAPSTAADDASGAAEFAGARTIEEVDALAGSRKQATTTKLQADAAEVGAKAETDKQATKAKLTTEAQEQKAQAPGAAPAASPAPAAAGTAAKEPATQESLVADLDAAQAKEEGELDADKEKGLAEIDAKIAAQKQIMDGAVLGDSATASTDADLANESKTQKAAVLGQFGTDLKANSARAVEDNKIAQDRAGKEADALVKRGDDEAANIEKQGYVDGVKAQTDFLVRGSTVMTNAAAAAQKVRDDGKPDAQADQVMSEASGTFSKMVADGVAALQRIVAAAKTAAQKHRDDAKAAADKLRADGAGNAGKAYIANAMGISTMAVAQAKNSASVDAATKDATSDVHATADAGREKQRAKAGETMAQLEKQRQELADRLDAQIAQQKKGVEMRITALKQQVKIAGPAGAARLGSFVSASLGQMDKISDQVDASIEFQAKMLENRFEAEVRQTTAAMAVQGKQILRDIDAAARAAKLKIAKAGQAAVAAQADSGFAVRKQIDDATREAEGATDKEANALAGGLAKQARIAEGNLDAEEAAAKTAADDEGQEADDRTAKLESEDFAEMQRKADAAAAKIKDKIGRFHLTTDQTGINEILREYADDPDTMKMIREEYKRQTGKDLNEKLSGVMHDAEIKEAKAYEAGDMETANVAIVQQGDSDRIEKDVDGYYKDHPEKVEAFAEASEEQTGEKATKLLEDAGIDKPLAITSELAQAETDLKTKEDTRLSEAEEKFRTENKDNPEKVHATELKMGDMATKLNTALGSSMHVGSRVDVTNLLVDEEGRALEPAQVAILKEQYAKAYPPPEPSLDDMIAQKLSGKDLKAVKAELSGDNVRAAEARVEQAADGLGTNLEEWQKAMESLKTPEERARFKQIIEKHTGRTYDELNKSENSGFDRDKMHAEGLVDQTDHDVGIATADYMKSTHGGKIAQIEDAIGDTIGDELGESDETRTERRKIMREATHVTEMVMPQAFGLAGTMDQLGLSNNNDGALDAMASLKDSDGNIDPEKMRRFKEQVENQAGESVDDINKREMKGHNLEAAKDLSAGNALDAMADRMFAGSEHLIHNDRDAMSKGLEAAAADKEHPERFIQLKEKLDKKAQEMGFADYKAWSKAQGLDADEEERAEQRFDTGKVDDVTALKMAADTTLGFGKNVEQITQIMESYPPGPKLDQFKADFEAKYHMTLDDFIKSKATSAGEKRDFDILLKGNYDKLSPEELDKVATDNPEELIKRIKDLHSAARDGIGSFDAGNALGNALADATSNKGAEVDRRLKRAEELEAKVQGGETLSPEERQELVDEVHFMGGDKQGYVEQKNQVVANVAEVAGDVTEVGVDALTGSDEAGQLAGGLTKISIQLQLNPARYGIEQASQDLLQLGAQMAVGKLTGGIKNPFVQQMAAGGLGSMAGAMLNYKTMAGGLGNVLDEGLKAGETGALTGLAGAAISNLPGGKFAHAVLNEGASVVIADDWSQSVGDMAKGHAANLAKGIGIAGAHGGEHDEAGAKHEEHEEHEAAAKHGPSEEKAPEKAPEAKPAEEAPAPTATKPVEEAPAPVATKPVEEAPAPAPAQPAEVEAPAPVATKPVEEAPAPVATKPAEDAPAPAASKPAEPEAETKPAESAPEEPKKVGFGGADHEEMPEPKKLDPEGQKTIDATKELFDPEKALSKVKETYFDGEEVEEYEHDESHLSKVQNDMRQIAAGVGDQIGDCTVTSQSVQKALAKKGVEVELMSFEPQTAKGAEKTAIGHRFLVGPGGVMIDPTFSQMLTPPPGYDNSKPLPSGKRWFEPFAGNYEDLRVRVKEAIDHGFVEGADKSSNVDDVIRENWGLKPGPDGSLAFDKDVTPYGAEKKKAFGGAKEEAPAETSTPPPETAETTRPHEDGEISTTEVRGEELADLHVDIAGAENAAEIEARAKTQADALPEEQRADYDRMLGEADSNLARTLLERAMAAGNGMKEIAELAEKLRGMKDLGDDEILAVMTGKGGVVQASEQSCVPTSLQIAIAHVDPVFAMKLAENPQLLAAMQRAASDSAGSVFPQRGDVEGLPPEVEAAIARNPELREVLRDASRYSDEGTQIGLTTGDMPGMTLKTRLESTSGEDYQVKTLEGDQPDVGHGQFGEVPHADIQAALDRGGTVPFGAGNHARTLIKHFLDAEGNSCYVVRDPEGRTFAITAAELDALGPRYVMVPGKSEAGEISPASGEEGTTFGSAEKPEEEAATADAEEARIDAEAKKVKKAFPGLSEEEARTEAKELVEQAGPESAEKPRVTGKLVETIFAASDAVYNDMNLQGLETPEAMGKIKLVGDIVNIAKAVNEIRHHGGDANPSVIFEGLYSGGGMLLEQLIDHMSKQPGTGGAVVKELDKLKAMMQKNLPGAAERLVEVAKHLAKRDFADDMERAWAAIQALVQPPEAPRAPWEGAPETDGEVTLEGPGVDAQRSERAEIDEARRRQTEAEALANLAKGDDSELGDEARQRLEEARQRVAELEAQRAKQAEANAPSDEIVLDAERAAKVDAKKREVDEARHTAERLRVLARLAEGDDAGALAELTVETQEAEARLKELEGGYERMRVESAEPAQDQPPPAETEAEAEAEADRDAEREKRLQRRIKELRATFPLLPLDEILDEARDRDGS